MKSVKRGLTLAGGFAILLFTLAVNNACAQSGPPAFPEWPAGRLLDYWRFDDTNWLSARLNGPVAVYNVECIPSWHSNALQVSSVDPALLQYSWTNANNGRTNFTCDFGTFRFWFKPDWNGTNAGGDGPQSWGRLIEVGE